MDQQTTDAIADRASQEQRARVREDGRLKKEPFKTMVEVTDSDTLNELRGWIPPRNRAYVLLEVNYYDLSNQLWRKKLMTIDVEGRPEQQTKLRQYIEQKKARIIHYGDFPHEGMADKVRARKIKLYGGFDDVDHWKELERFCKTQMSQVNITPEEYSELRRKAAEYEKQQLAKANPTKPTANTRIGGADSGTSKES